MTDQEYAAYTVAREAATTRELRANMSEGDARERTRQGTARFLPHGVDTEGHHLIIAEDGAGHAVGNAWVGPDPYRDGMAADSAWLYDINVFPEVRRRGYGSAILTAVEALVASEGAERLGLNVFGSNHAAIAMYRKNGYEISTQQLTKRIGRS